MKYTVAPATNVLVIRDGKVLLSRRANTDWLNGHLCLPGGHVEEGETPHQALIREIKEELGVTVRENELKFICSVYSTSTPTGYASFEFQLVNTSYNFINNEPDKCSELVWADLDSLPEETIERFRMVIEEGYQQGSSYIVTDD